MLAYGRRMSLSAFRVALVLAAASSLAGGCFSPGPGYGVRRDVYVGGVHEDHRDAPAEHHDDHTDEHHDEQHNDQGH